MTANRTIDDPAKRPGKPKQDRSRRMRERLLAAGRVCVERMGYDTMGIGDVAKEAGCSTGAFYHHFSGKEEFYRALVGRGTDAAAVRVDEFFDQPEHRQKPIEAFLNDAVALQMQLLRDNRELLVVTLAKALADRDAWMPVRAVGMQFAERLLSHLQERNLPIGGPDPDRTIRIAVQVMQSTFLQMITISRGPLRIEDPDVVDELTNVMLSYLGLRR